MTRPLGARSWLLPLLFVLGSCGLVLPSGHPTRDYTPVVAAASSGDIAAVRSALDADPKLVRATEWNGATLLHDAVQHGQADVAALLLDRRAKIDARTADGLTPLHMAAQNGDLPLIGLLLARQAAINPLDARGWTPLDRAVRWEHPDAAAALRMRGGKEGRADPGAARQPAERR